MSVIVIFAVSVAVALVRVVAAAAVVFVVSGMPEIAQLVARVLDGWKFLQSGLRRRPRRCGGGGTAASAW